MSGKRRKIQSMGVRKTSSKSVKKASKFDSLKNLVFGKGSSGQGTRKSGSSGGGQKGEKTSSTQQKKGLATPSKPSSGQKLGATKTKTAVPPVKGGKAPASAVAEPKASAKVNSRPARAVAKPAVSANTGGKNSQFSGALRRNAGAADTSASSGETVCREVACEGLSTSGGYCRLHYIKNWKKIKRKELILREKKLNQYIEELVAKYPDKYIEAIRQDLASDKDFAKVIYDLDLDETIDDFDVEGGESVDSLIDTIKRDFDDEGETF